MMRYLFLLFWLLLGCTPQPEEPPVDAEKFTKALQEHQGYFRIPGMAGIITKGGKTIWEHYHGYANLAEKTLLDETHRFPIASVSKTFAGVITMKLVEEGLLRLDDPVSNYLEGWDARIQVQHLLSHTSESEPGTRFNYSYRFSQLTPILEQVSGKTYPELLQTYVLDPLKLENTVPLINEKTVDSLRSVLATPYTFYGEIEEGRFDPGLSTASGLSSTVSDLARFEAGFEKLLSDESLEQMFTPFPSSEGRLLPYGLGTFVQEINGERVTWGYGQEDCFSSLTVRVPSQDLTFILLANNNLMSDPARLINGDLTFSLFALTFLKHFVFGVDQLQRETLAAEALAASFLGYGFPEEMERSKNLTRELLEAYPDFDNYASPTLMHLLMTLNTRGAMREIDEITKNVGTFLLQKDPLNPYLNIYMAFHFQGLEAPEKALPYFETIANAENFSPFWYTIEAYGFLGDYYQSKDPDIARRYWQKALDVGWNYNGIIDRAEAAIEDDQ